MERTERLGGRVADDDDLLKEMANLTPRRIVEELDRYVIAQAEAKRAVAIALRNRWRRLRVARDLRDEITPKNIIMIGPTGVGKTEISRRLAKLARAPFVKVEATKFTEVGYVGRDVETIIRDLAEVSHALVKQEERERVRERAAERVEDQLLDLLLPDGSADGRSVERSSDSGASASSTREKLRQLLRDGKLEERVVEVELTKQVNTHLEIVGAPGFAEVEGQLKEMFSNMLPKPKEKRRATIAEARTLLLSEAQENLLEPEQIARKAIQRAEQTGIVFIDEIDKVCGPGGGTRAPDVSREGVQRDLLPIVEGSTVQTKYGPVKTDHMLFIASGAFHHSKPSDLMPEFQGRFPIRVELKSLTAADFVRILTEPENALIRQYTELLGTEGVTLSFEPDATEELARLTADVNSRTEDIGARRLHTLLERMLDDISFSADERQGERLHISAQYVRERLSSLVEDTDVARFIL